MKVIKYNIQVNNHDLVTAIEVLEFFLTRRGKYLALEGD